MSAPSKSEHGKVHADALQDLIGKLESATGPSRRLDAEIWLIENGPWGYQGVKPHADDCQHTPNRSPSCTCGADTLNSEAAWIRGASYSNDPTHPGFAPRQLLIYTASLDAAVGLAERVLPGFSRASGNCGVENVPWACLTEPDGKCRDFYADAATEPLAICLAILRALQHAQSSAESAAVNASSAQEPQVQTQHKAQSHD